MTLNGAIMQLVELSEHPMMPAIFRPAIQKVIETISELEENPEPHWIPVTERLPEKLDYYLVSGNNSVWLARYESGRFLGVLSGHALDTVIAWMPLPEPAKGYDNA